MKRCTTIADAYAYYSELCNDEPQRSEDEVQDYIHERKLRYEKLDQAFWDEMFDSGWAWGDTQRG